MGVSASRYEDIRAQLRPGDVIAFAGADLFSRLVSLAMDYPVSHVGIVAEATGRGGPALVHAVMHRGAGGAPRGVHRAALDDVLLRTRGKVWWLPLRPRAVRDAAGLERYLQSVVGTPFDATGGLRAVLSELCERLFGNDLSELDGSPDELYCAELVTTALMRAGVLPPGDASDASPSDVCRWSIYADRYHYIGMAPAAELPAFNSVVSGTGSPGWRDRPAFASGGRRLADELRAAGDTGVAARVEAAVHRLG